MNPEIAVATLHAMLQGIAFESPVTRKVIAAIPDGQEAFKPHEKSMSAIDLAWHIAASEIWFMDGVANGAFNPHESGRPEAIKTAADVLAFYDAELPKKLEALKALSAEQLVKPIDFYGVFNLPAVAYLGFASSHAIHHRGQLSVYVRLAGGKVPSIYGGSADDPFVPPSK